VEPTQLVVIMSTDLGVTSELDGLRIGVASPEGDVVLDETYTLVPRPGPIVGLASFGVRPRNDDASRRIRVDAEGLAGGVATVATGAVSSFVRDQRMRLDLFLARSCVGSSCTAPDVCREGACVPPDVAVEDLEPFRPEDDVEGAVGDPPTCAPPDGEVCEPVSPSCGCPEGQACRIDASLEIVCGPNGGAPEGSICGRDEDCDAGLACEQVEIGRDGTCAPYCRSSDACPSGVCAVLRPEVGVCTQLCDPLAGGCGVNLACVVVEVNTLETPDVRTTACVRADETAEGDACGPGVAICREGQLCFASVCRWLCEAGGACPDFRTCSPADLTVRGVDYDVCL
jgi:hypothetical protein